MGSILREHKASHNQRRFAGTDGAGAGASAGALAAGGRPLTLSRAGGSAGAAVAVLAELLEPESMY